MLDFLELEETVGRAWHRLVGGTASYPVHAGPCGLAGRDAEPDRGHVPRAWRRGRRADRKLQCPQVRASARLAAAHRAWRRAPRSAGARRRDRVPAGPHRDLSRSRPERFALSLARRLVRDRAGRTTVEDTIRCGAISSMLRRARETAAAVLARFPGLVRILRAAVRCDGAARGRADRCRAPNRRWSRSCWPCSVPRRRPKESSGRP